MSNYRDLNKELVEQVQTMRKNMKLYSDEIVYLKGELMQKHESQVFLKNQCYSWAINNFVQLIQCVKPESDILPILKEHIDSKERTSSTSTQNSVWRERRSDARRRSSLLTRDFQRSSSILQLRKSVCSTSPIRSYNEASDDEEEPNIPEGTEVLENEENTDEEAQNEISKTVRYTEIENIIYEESDEETQEITRDEDLDVESVYESMEEESINVPENRSALNNITNSLKSTNNSQKGQNIHAQDIIKIRVQPMRTKKKVLSEKENSTDENSTKEDSDIDITTTKRILTRHTKITTEKSNIDFEEETIQELRRYGNSKCNIFNTNKSISLKPKGNETSKVDLTLSPSTLKFNELTIRDFSDVVCSTPNSRQNSLEKKTITTQCETNSNLQTSSNTSSSTRPSRHCKPKNLTEPGLCKKLRNETETKTKLKGKNTSSKPKPKSKTKK